MLSKQDYIKLLSNPFVKAGLDTIAKAEGVKYGYNTLYGNTSFSDLSRHPNKKITKWGITSSAAGRYQFIYNTWKGISSKLGLNDFSPLNQDIAALYLINQANALQDLNNGNIEAVVSKIKKIWASLPGAGYGQKERSLSTIKKWYSEYTNGAKFNDIVKNDYTNVLLLLGTLGLGYYLYRY